MNFLFLLFIPLDWHASFHFRQIAVLFAFHGVLCFAFGLMYHDRLELIPEITLV